MTGTPLSSKRPVCIAVTQLTSTTEAMMQKELRIKGSMEEVVVQYGKNAKKAGLDGIVCSALEVPTIQKRISPDFVTVTPGIRLLGDKKGDQRRVVTPDEARRLGSTAIVVGRSITRAENVKATYDHVLQLWGEENEKRHGSTTIKN